MLPLVFLSKRKFRSFVSAEASTRDDDEPIQQSIYHIFIYHIKYHFSNVYQIYQSRIYTIGTSKMPQNFIKKNKMNKNKNSGFPLINRLINMEKQNYQRQK